MSHRRRGWTSGVVWKTPEIGWNPRIFDLGWRLAGSWAAHVPLARDMLQSAIFSRAFLRPRCPAKKIWDIASLEEGRAFSGSRPFPPSLTEYHEYCWPDSCPPGWRTGFDLVRSQILPSIISEYGVDARVAVDKMRQMAEEPEGECDPILPRPVSPI